jgi:hypothetical protein
MGIKNFGFSKSKKKVAPQVGLAYNPPVNGAI